jgi:hypothetical protein
MNVTEINVDRVKNQPPKTFMVSCSYETAPGPVVPRYL